MKISMLCRSAAAVLLCLTAMAASAQNSPAELRIPTLGETATEAHGSAPQAPKPLTAVNAFVDAPAEVFPTIDSMTRMDMVDYFNSGSERPSKNAFKGNCRILSISPQQITVETSDVSTVELSLLRQDNDTILMLITTLKTPVDDSNVKFYTRNWEPITKGLFMVPLLDDWTTEEGKKNKADLENSVPFMLARCTFVPETSTLTLTNNLGAYLPEEALGLAKGSLMQSISYRWNGKRMERVK